MKINSIKPYVINTYNQKKAYNIPSYGARENLSDNQLLLSYDNWRANPENLLKIIKSQKDNKDASLIFAMIIDLRGEDLRRKRILEKKAETESKIKNVKQKYQRIINNRPDLYNLFKENIKEVNEIEKIANNYPKIEPVNDSRFKIYGKAAKLLSKMPSFDPNYSTWDYDLVNDSLSNYDNELIKILLKHKKYEGKSYLDLNDENYKLLKMQETYYHLR